MKVLVVDDAKVVRLALRGIMQQRGWDVVAPHHELSAGFMAEGYSRMTGRPALAIATLGPGIANAAGAMMCAKVENTPVIFLGGQRADLGRDPFGG